MPKGEGKGGHALRAQVSPATSPGEPGSQGRPGRTAPFAIYRKNKRLMRLY